MTETQEVQTRFGEVQIETVECDSCENTIAKEDAHEFTLGDREGHACSHCVDDGPISFPPSVDIAIKGHSAEMTLTPIAVWPLFMIPTLATTIFDDNEPAKEFTVGSIATFIWTTLPLLLLLYFGIL